MSRKRFHQVDSKQTKEENKRKKLIVSRINMSATTNSLMAFQLDSPNIITTIAQIWRVAICL